MSIRIGPGTMIAGFQHPGGGGGGGGGGSFASPTVVWNDPFNTNSQSYSFNGVDQANVISVNTNNLNPAGQSWCVEGFFYQTDSNPFPRLFSIGAYPSAAIAISLEGGTMYCWVNGAAVGTTTKPNSLTWNHFAIAHDADQNRTLCCLNGYPFAITANDMPDISGMTLNIGAETLAGAPNANFGGFINSFRWTVGNPVYVGTFTPPTSVLATTQDGDGGSINAITAGQVKLLM